MNYFAHLLSAFVIYSASLAPSDVPKVVDRHTEAIKCINQAAQTIYANEYTAIPRCVTLLEDLADCANSQDTSPTCYNYLGLTENDLTRAREARQRQRKGTL